MPERGSNPRSPIFQQAALPMHQGITYNTFFINLYFSQRKNICYCILHPNRVTAVVSYFYSCEVSVQNHHDVFLHIKKQVTQGALKIRNKILEN